MPSSTPSTTAGGTARQYRSGSSTRLQLPAGSAALLAEPSDPAHVTLLYADLRRDLTCRDLVPGARTVLLDGLEDLDR